MLLFSKVFLLVLICLWSVSDGEIHRARGIKPPKYIDRKLSPRSTWPPGPNLESIPPAPAYGEKEGEVQKNSLKNEQHQKEEHSNETWLYSLISACLVGLSGIFPLIIIPLESGEALKHGAPAAKLKLLLSFAVGGLLGDVFLHLLPEAWAHLKGYESHKNAGIWVIAGLCCFLIIEKIFPEDEDDDEDDEDTEIDNVQEFDHNTKVFTETRSPYPLRSRKNLTIEQKNCKEQNGHINSYNDNKSGYHKNGILQNGKMDTQNGAVVNGAVLHNGDVCNGGMNGDIPASKSINSHHASNSQKSHIKTSGWLNLIANVIDNFTHGLAVAGSYCVSTKVGMLTTFAILLHEIPHEVGDFAILLKAGFDRWKAAKAQILTATGGLVGALCALMADSAQEAGNKTAWILPFTSGGFIYIAMVTVVPDLVKEKNNRESIKQLMFLGLGIVVMALVTLFFD